jgi:two-component system, chemotaxis family, CheB/CheR fusion protein
LNAANILSCKPDDYNRHVPADRDFPIVCLGGSAGSLPAFTEVLREIPVAAGLAIVIISHRRRGWTELAEILAKNTSIPVVLIESGLKIQNNHIYINPPNHDVTLKDGAFQLSPLSKKQGWPNVISVFLESLASEWQGTAIAVILSGLDSDGVRALRSVKAVGGITFAQKIETAEQPSMPREAIETGCVDFELAPADIGRQLVSIAGPKELSLSADEAEPEPTPAMGFPIVGVGASAGGLEAFILLLEHLPSDTGMAFVLIQHLDPKHQSQLTEILSKKSAMPMQEVDGSAVIQVNHVYVMPAEMNLTIAGGVLQTVPRSEIGGRNMPIDQFLKALAKDQQAGAFGVILSGTGSDGSLGIGAIKAEGGITFAQEPASAKFDGMPRSAIAVGAVDFTLSPERIAQQLIELRSHPYVRNGLGATPEPTPAGRDLDRIFTRLRAVTGIDFASYKHNTIIRRIRRRMALHGMESSRDYCRMVEQNNVEAGVLAQDFLVHVTSFFREPELHRALPGSVFAALLQGRPQEDAIRVWVPGCSTGEEVYSLAISLSEFLEKQTVRPEVLIFATDLNQVVIDKARAGVYLESALANVSPERLGRFFVKRNRLYQISQPLRDLCIFARHDVTRDPPLSKMDLISCCNLLIYLGPILQKRTLSMFHYALKPNGFLLLGSSESVGALPESFETVDRKNKIFSKKSAPVRPVFDLVNGGVTTGMSLIPRLPADLSSTSNSVQKQAERMLLAEYAPPSVVIDDAMRVLQVRGIIDPYLQVPQGQPTTSLRLMVRPGLLAGLNAAFEAASTRNLSTGEHGLRLREDDRLVNLRISPIRGLHGKDRCFLVVFEDSEQHKPRNAAETKLRTLSAPPQAGERAVQQLQQEVARLEQELAETREWLQSIVEAQEAAAEELRSSNEEAQATNEELNTAKEELQASNEELNTVNEELRIRNIEQSSLNTDLRKLLESINIPLVMVGKDLRIRWFTAAMQPVLNLLPNDQGRPITDLRSTVVPDFAGMLVRTFAGSEEKHVEFQRSDGAWLSLRMLPYHGPTGTIEGAIATLNNIDDLVRARDFAEAVVATVREPLVVLDAQLRVRTANGAFYKIFQLEKDETEGRLFYEIGGGQWDIPKLRLLLEDVLPKNSSLKEFEIEIRPNERIPARTVLLNAREIRQHEGERTILLAIDDITELRRSTQELGKTNEDLKQFIFAASHDLQEPIRMIVTHTQILAASFAGRLDDKTESSIAYAIDGALRLERLILSLREFWQLSERDADSRSLIDCNEVLRKVLLNLEGAVAVSKADIVVDQLPSLMASEATLIQLFQNLVANAIKYRADDPPKIRISARGDAAGWIFSVRDNGIGIDPEYAQQIFGVFKRLHARDEYSGTGIGLAICQKIVERYQGRIWVESELGHGSDFKFAIPARPHDRRNEQPANANSD